MALRRSHLAIVVTFVLLLVLYLGHRPPSDPIDWSQYAYSQYATDSGSLCNALMVFDALHRYGSRAERVLLYPKEWDLTIESPVDRDSQLLVWARDKYKVNLVPIALLAVSGNGEAGTFGMRWRDMMKGRRLTRPDSPQAGWDASLTKLMAFTLKQYKRVLQIDSDITLLQHMDELFLLPPTPIAMPRAYWMDTVPGQAVPLTSLLVLLEPNAHDLDYMLELVEKSERPLYDMEVLNTRFGSSAMVLPHRPYALLSAEFRKRDHSAYLGGPASLIPWDADAAKAEAKLIHFSDWPLPKPWIMWPIAGKVEMQPDCGERFKEGCREREIWKDLYDDFRRRRKQVCLVLSVPAPDWGQIKAASKQQ